MVKKISSIALSGELEAFWPTVALNTQKVMDAAMASAEKGGAEVAV